MDIESRKVESMTQFTRCLSWCVAMSMVVMSTALIDGCGSSRRTVIEGYSDEELNGRRIAILYPRAYQLSLTNNELLGASRGTTGASAAETFEGELRTMLVAAIQDRLDSNTVLNY